MGPFLSVEAIRRWQILSTLRYWGTTKTWENGPRLLLQGLNPPFIPENEILLFDAPFYNPKNEFVVYVTRITWQNVRLQSGFFVATDSRFVFGNVKNRFADQIPYRDVRAIYSQSSSSETRCFDIVLEGGTKFGIEFQIPKVGGLGATLGAVFGSAVAQTVIEKTKVNEINKFYENFVGFVTEIANENKLRLRSA